MCCCLQTAAHIEGKHAQRCTPTQSYIHVHRQQHHSIILVEGQSIYCWLTGIQSPFPTGPEWKNGRQPVKRPTLIVDWWDKSWGGSWGILYRNKRTIKNLSCQTAQKNVYLLLCILAAIDVRFAKMLFLPFNHKKPISMWWVSVLCVPRGYHFSFNAAKHSYSLIEMQKQVEVRAKYGIWTMEQRKKSFTKIQSSKVDCQVGD